MTALRLRISVLSAIVLALLTLTTTWAGFHYCAMPAGMGDNPNHTCDTCFTHTRTIVVEPYPGYFITYPLFVTCAANPNPGGCLRYPSLASPTTSTCNITSGGSCGTGVMYHLSPDCHDSDVNGFVQAAWGTDPATEPCVGQKVTVTGGSANGVDCSGTTYETVYN